MTSTISAEQLTVDGYLQEPFDPFSGVLEGITVHDIDDQAFTGKEIPVGLAIALFIICRPKGVGLETNKTGLRRVYRYHGDKVMSSINSLTLRADEERVRAEAAENLDRREQTLDTMTNEWRRERRRQDIEKRRRAEGEGAWLNYRDAVATLFKFVSGIADVRSPTRADRPRPRRGSDRCALTEEQMVLLWNAASIEGDAELALLYLDCLRETAARVHAVRGLNLEDIDWATGIATFRTKNRRIHRACLSIDLMQRIRDRAQRQGWNGDIPENYDPRSFDAVGTPVFRTDDMRRINRKWTENFFCRLDERIARPHFSKITAHWIRHTTITQVERLVGKDAAQRWAGHKVGQHAAAADQTETYIKWTNEERQAIFNYMFPATPTGAWHDRRTQLHLVAGGLSA